ncbi:MAG TPA: hypothetical protein VFN73_07755 [Propionibacteriaceae bacterium]|nr:hypothetical protein [Propionibacteriaceae bacterium]
MSGADVGAGKKTNPRAIQPNAATANAVSIGTEAVIAVRDVLGLDHDEARAHGEWAVRELVRAGRH